MSRVAGVQFGQRVVYAAHLRRAPHLQWRRLRGGTEKLSRDVGALPGSLESEQLDRLLHASGHRRNHDI